jgi:hypothetical protein
MSEREAWLYLAREWDDARDYYGMYAITMNKQFYYGLCPCINALESLKMVGPIVSRQMWAKIQARVKRKHVMVNLCKYMTKCNESGAKIRAEFCRQQAENIRV